MKIISISGLDGSGKSTQIQMLKEYLESQGKRVFYFHAIQFGIAQKIKEFLFFKKNYDNKKLLSQKSVVRANVFQILLRKIFLKIDICRFEKMIKKLEREGYDYLLTDRYFYDSIVNIEYLSSSKAKLWKISGLGFRTPDLAFYLQTDLEVIMQRERKPDQGIEYLKKKKEIFDKYSSVWNLKIIDGNRTKEEIFGEIKNIIYVD